MDPRESITCLLRLIFSTLSICGSVWGHPDYLENAPGKYWEDKLLNQGRFSIAGMVFFALSVLVEMSSPKLKKLEKWPYIMNLFGSLVLVTATIVWYFTHKMSFYERLDFEERFPDMFSGCWLGGGLATLVAQGFISLEVRKKSLDPIFMYASLVGVVASLMYALGGIFGLEQLAEARGVLDSRQNMRDNSIMINNFFISGSSLYAVHAIILFLAFAGKESEEEGGEEDEEEGQEKVELYDLNRSNRQEQES